MTAQSGDKIFYKGKTRTMASEPLAPYLKKHKFSFIPPTTACWRGYEGNWRISKNKLILFRLKAFINNYEEVGLDHIFPGQKAVFAEWFTGEIRIPDGELLNYVHGSYASSFERDLVLEFKSGILVNHKVVTNAIEPAIIDYDEDF